MKILKIELQNINSLKSDFPIVIDFTSENFRDVGLFVITGSTGAGKTTILDTITIAMYHEVPRFNKSNIKGTLVDVVSYGASDALARVTFEVKGEIFESQWSMRLATSTGKKLSNPKEEVRLKNLTKETIIAEKKRELELEIERITQLSYSQFLRSVMLAQGEFAAFLSADAKDKGNLLEQITGEDIYKKIGETISDKIYEERKILDAIKAKINTEDLLTEEIRLSLHTESEIVTENIKQIDAELKQLKLTIDWFERNNNLHLSKEQLEKDKTELVIDFENNRERLTLLELHEKAEPFKETLDELNRIKNELEIKQDRLQKISIELNAIELNLADAQKEELLKKEVFSNSENEQKAWMPKLEEVTKLDTKISNIQANTEIVKKNTKELNSIIEGLNERNKTILDSISKKENERKSLEKFVKEHSNLHEVDKRFSQWNTGLTIRKSKRERLSEIKQNILKFGAERDQTDKDIHKQSELLNEHRITLENRKKECEEISNQLISYNLEDFLEQQKQKEVLKNQCKDLYHLSVQFTSLEKDATKLEEAKNELNKNLQEFSGLIQDVQEKIKLTEISVQDAEKILEQERTIKSFDEERKKLIKGHECPLCGSKEHPFIENYQSMELSKTQLIVDDRKKSLDILRTDEKNYSVKIAEINTKIDSNINRLKEIYNQLKDTKQKFESFNSEFKTDDLTGIEIKGKFLKDELNQLSENITKAQQLQKQKNEMEKSINMDNELLAKLNTEIEKLKEKKDGLTKSIFENDQDYQLKLKELESMEMELEKEFSTFEYPLPSPENTITFLNQLEHSLADFKTKIKELNELTHAITQHQVDVKNMVEQLTEKNIEKTTREQELSTLHAQIQEITDTRNSILPITISTQTKREELQINLENAKNEFEKISLWISGLNTKKASTQKEQENINLEILDIQSKITHKSSALETSIQQSIFTSKTELEQAFLNTDDKVKFFTIKKQLEDKSLSLKTLEAKLQEDFIKLESQKTADITYDEAINKHTETEFKKENLLKRSGEIDEKIKLDNQIKERNKGVVDEIDRQEKVLKKWTDLFALLGGSKHAFNTYVQRLTLKNLINLANIHLFKLNRRYSLQMSETYKPGEELNFQLVDHYQTDEARLVDTSSGGEKFLISLALALGLSDLASKNVKIGSLFIDEGFGTLDNNTLETVISTLETLHAQGKMIGIISHVENLKERIPAQIQVTKKSNGVSEVEVQ